MEEIDLRTDSPDAELDPHALVSAIPAPAAVVDRDGRVRAANREWSDLAGDASVAGRPPARAALGGGFTLLTRQRLRLDAVTGVADRSVLDRLLDHLEAVGGLVAFCDLDRFKAINDTHGHSVGDLVLEVVAARLDGAVRGADRVVRYGGDEFVVVTFGAGDPESLCRRLRAAVAEPIVAPGETEIPVGLSVAAAPVLVDGDARAALDTADLACLAQKRRGRDGHRAPVGGSAEPSGPTAPVTDG